MSEHKNRLCINCFGPIRCGLCGTLQVEPEPEGILVEAERLSSDTLLIHDELDDSWEIEELRTLRITSVEEEK